MIIRYIRAGIFVIFTVCVLICALNSIGALYETQSSWQGGPGVVGPVITWSDSFYSSENMNWNNSESNIYLDYAENCSEHVIDGSAGAPYSVVSVNMDSDTDTDLLVASCSDNIVAWYGNEGNGQSWTSLK